MDFEEKIEAIFEDKPNQRMGMYAVQTDHPGLMPSLKKSKTSKVDRSLLANDKDASRQYIKGTMDASGRAKGKNDDD
jgi:hypothetical protein